MDGRLFGLDLQLIFDAMVMFIFIMLLYIILSKLFFKPVRAFLEKRQAFIDNTLAEAKDDEQKVSELKAVYEEKQKAVRKEAEGLMSESRRQSVREQEARIEAARKEARKIMEKARIETEAQRQQYASQVLTESAQIAALLAGQYVNVSKADEAAAYVKKVYSEMDGDS